MFLNNHYKSIYIALAISCIAPMSIFAEEEPLAEVENAVVATKIDGKKIFDSICIHCHKITYEASAIGAPGLQGVLERHEETWLNQWIKNPETFAKINVAARDLVDSNRFGLVMPTIPAMQEDEQRAAVIEYLKTLK